MNEKVQAISKSPINVNKKDLGFLNEVMKRSGQNFNMCWHCQTCVGGCPFSEFMDYPPNKIIRLVQLGQKKKALECSAIWLCVGCNTCSIQCPNAIDIPAVNDAIREIALAEGATVAEPDILNFHQEVLRSVQRYGRTHKFEIMFRYKLRKRDFFSDMVVGLKMLLKRKLEILPSKSGDVAQIKRLFHRGQVV